MSGFPLPMVGFCAFSGTGKTTLLIQLLPMLRATGLRVGVVKHAHHQFEIDHDGKDSYRLRKAGANQMLIASRKRLAWVEERGENAAEPTLAEVLPALQQQQLDLVLVEGFKREAIPKVELHRRELGKPLIFPDDPNVIAIATNYALGENAAGLPTLDINQPQDIVTFIREEIIERKSPVHQPTKSATP